MSEQETHKDQGKIERRGLLLVLSSPSGAGKTTIARHLLESDPGISLSVSVTTRVARPGEVDGVDYRFVDRQQFEAMRLNGELLEWAQVYDNCYGTLRAPVEAMLARGQDVLFDIDWQGAQQLGEKMARDLVRVFILPPSVQVLEERLKRRNQDSLDTVARRMSEAAFQISHWAEYDYVIVNTDVSQSLSSVRSILHAERMKRERQLGLSSFVRSMQKEL